MDHEVYRFWKDQTMDSSATPAQLTISNPGLRWYQYSLRTLLVFVLLVAMGLALFVTGRRFRQAEAELAEYRREYGILKIENPTTLQAIALWTGEPNHWRWRVYLPAGRYDLCFLTAGVPESGIPEPKNGCNADFAGLVEIAVAAYKDPKDGVWRYAISSQGPDGGRTTYADMSVTPADEGMSDSNGGVNRDKDPVTVPPDDPLVLLRKRAVKHGVMEMSSGKAYGGLMLWIRRTGDWRGDNYSRSW
jgi:hypothetical protein